MTPSNMSQTIVLTREQAAANAGIDVKKQLVSQAGPASVSRGGVTTRWRSATDIIALGKYCASKEAGGCVIDDCVMEFGRSR